MFVFALTARFGGPAPTGAELGAMMAGFPLAPSDGGGTAQAPRASAGVARWAVVDRDRTAAPSWDGARGLLFAGDVRLYNRPELIAELGAPPAALRDRSDLDLARLAYLRWGQGAPAHLVGDFAFAAWEEKTGTLFAARDHFGVRPLVYRFTRDGVAVASDVRQLLPLVERPGDDISGEQILDGLLHRPTDARRTYFRSVARVPPGHAIVADAAGVTDARYWLPPTSPDQGLSYAETCERLRALFSRAVRDRLESARPLVAHSSGGFDSSTIVVAADRIYREEPSRPSLTMVSGVVPGHVADESRYMDAVAAQVAFPEVRWNIVADGPAPSWEVSRAAPTLRHGPAGGPRRDLEVAHERGARVLLSGVLGDSLWYARSVRRDMVRRGRWLQAGYDVLRAGINGGTLRRFVDAGLGVFSPDLAARLGDRWLTSREPMPKWLGPALLALYARSRPAAPARPDLTGTAWPSHLFRGVWAQLTSPTAARVVDSFVAYAGEEGVELRAPYADVRLAEAVLRMPWQLREPHGHHRRTGRDALGPTLPTIFSQRVGQQPWTSVWAANARRNALAMAPYIERGPWSSAPFVDRGIARAMLDDVRAGRDVDTPKVSILVAQFGALEAWIRQLFG